MDSAKDNAAPALNTRGLQLGPGEMDRVASLNIEIERLQASNTPAATARAQELIDQRAQIFATAIARRQNANN